MSCDFLRCLWLGMDLFGYRAYVEIIFGQFGTNFGSKISKNRQKLTFVDKNLHFSVKNGFISISCSFLKFLWFKVSEQGHTSI